MGFVHEETKIQVFLHPVQSDCLVILASNWELVKTLLLLTNTKQ